MKPGSSTPGEYCAAWQAPGSGNDPHERCIGDFADRVVPTAQSYPGRSGEVVLAQTVSPGLRDVKWAGRQLDWDQRSPRHTWSLEEAQRSFNAACKGSSAPCVASQRGSLSDWRRTLRETGKGESGRPVSNRLPQPWEGCALPGELRPLGRDKRF